MSQTYYYLFADLSGDTLKILSIIPYRVSRSVNPIKKVIYDDIAVFESLYRAGVIEVDELVELSDFLLEESRYSDGDYEVEDLILDYLSSHARVPTDWADLMWQRVRGMTGEELYERTASLNQPTALIFLNSSHEAYLQDSASLIDDLAA